VGRAFVKVGDLVETTISRDGAVIRPVILVPKKANVGSCEEIMNNTTQISALVSRTTKELLERHVRATGVKKGHLVEQALRHHLQVLQELPADVIVHPKLVVTRTSGATILKQAAERRRAST